MDYDGQDWTEIFPPGVTIGGDAVERRIWGEGRGTPIPSRLFCCLNLSGIFISILLERAA